MSITVSCMEWVTREKVVYELDKGRIQALLVPNEFHIGVSECERAGNKAGVPYSGNEKCDDRIFDGGQRTSL